MALVVNTNSKGHHVTMAVFGVRDHVIHYVHDCGQILSRWLTSSRRLYLASIMVTMGITRAPRSLLNIWHWPKSLDKVLDETRYDERPLTWSNQIIQGKSRWKSAHWFQSNNRRLRNYRNSADCGKQLIRYGWPSLDRWVARCALHTWWLIVWCCQTATHYLKRCWPCHKTQVAGANGVTASSSVAQDAWATMRWIKKWYEYRLARNWNKSHLQFFIRPIEVNYVAPFIWKAMT